MAVAEPRSERPYGHAVPAAAPATGVLAGAFDEFPLLESGASTHQGDEMRGVDSPPPVLG